MTRESMTAAIRSTVAENSVCWCEGRRMRNTRAPRPGGLESDAAEDGIRLRFYTAELWFNGSACPQRRQATRTLAKTISPRKTQENPSSKTSVLSVFSW